MEQQNISQQDALLTIEIFRKALGYRPQIRKAILGEDFLGLQPVDRVAETLTPRIAVLHADDSDGIPSLFFRFVGEESPIIEAIYYPFEAIYSFLDEARYLVRKLSHPERSNEEIEEEAVHHTTEMTLILFDNFYQRAELMMASFTSEVIAQWHIQTRQNVIQEQAERGYLMPRQKDTSIERAVKDYTKMIFQLWKYQGQTQQSWRKIRLAEEYETIHRHWKRLSKMCSDIEWREYAKIPKFEDTPDDLLDKLMDIDRRDAKTTDTRVSELAIEHAARRVSLIKNYGVHESVINRRRRGIKISGYSSGQLFEFLRQGRDLKAKVQAAQEALAQDNVAPLPEQESESAQDKDTKSPEQTLDSTQATSKGND